MDADLDYADLENNAVNENGDLNGDLTDMDGSFSDFHNLTLMKIHFERDLKVFSLIA